MSKDVAMSDADRPWEARFTAEEREIYRLYRRPSREPFPWGAHALLIVDATAAFVGPRLPAVEAASLVRTACGLPAWSAVARMAELLSVFRAIDRPVIYTVAADEGSLGGATIGRAESGDGNSIVAEIAPRSTDVVLEKPRASAFFATALAPYLIRNSIQGIVIAGGSTSGCVRATVLDGSSYGFRMAIAHDACFDRSALSHDVAIFELDAKYATAVSSTVVAHESQRAARA